MSRSPYVVDSKAQVRNNVGGLCAGDVGDCLGGDRVFQVFRRVEQAAALAEPAPVGSLPSSHAGRLALGDNCIARAFVDQDRMIDTRILRDDRHSKRHSQVGCMHKHHYGADEMTTVSGFAILWLQLVKPGTDGDAGRMATDGDEDP